MLTQDLPITSKRSITAIETITTLDGEIERLIIELENQPFWNLVFAPDTSPRALLAFLRECMFAVHCYQRHTTEAGFLMISRLPKDENALLKATILHKTEEAEHGTWALRDFVLLGGDPSRAEHATSPATFAVAAVWDRMSRLEDPFGYFGAEYLFEYLTLKLTARILPVLQQKCSSVEGLGFIFTHATEDEKHSKLIRALICDVVTRYPGSETSMLRCFQNFRQVYPIPIWTEAYERSLSEG